MFFFPEYSAFDKLQIAATTSSSADDIPEPDRLAALLKIAAQGNVKAFDEFYTLTVRKTGRVVRQFVGDNYKEDVLSETYLQAWQQSGRFDAQRASAIAWLNTIARSRALDRLRAERQRHGAAASTPSEHDCDLLESPEPGPDKVLETQQAHGSLNAAIAALSGAERWVVGLAYHGEMSHSQIADATTLPLGTVKSILNRCPQKMRLFLDSQAGALPRPQSA